MNLLIVYTCHVSQAFRLTSTSIAITTVKSEEDAYLQKHHPGFVAIAA
jgi:hypothetical protein